MPDVSVTTENIHATVTDLQTRARAMLEAVDAFKRTYDSQVVEGRGLVGKNEQQLTSTVGSWYPTYRAKTVEFVNTFGTSLKDAANAVLEAGGNPPDITFTPVS